MKVKECLAKIKTLFAKPKYTKLNITTEAWIKLNCYINLVDDLEVTGFGKIEDDTITDFKIVKQIATGTTANATDDAIIDLLRSIPEENIEKWTLDWHSHVDMETFKSGTDKANYRIMHQARGYKQFPIMIVNKRGDVLLQDYINEDNTPDIELTLLKKDVDDKTIETIYAECKKDVEEKVDEYIEPRKPKTTTPAKTYSWHEMYKMNNKKKEPQFCDICGCELITEMEKAQGLCEYCFSWGWAY